MLELKQVSFAYPGSDFKLQDMSFTLGAGEWVLLYGRNGSGKTTLALLLLGIVKPGRGEYRADGTDGRSLSLQAMGCHIGFVRQEADKQLVGDTVLAEMLFPARATREGIRAADALLERFSLRQYRKASPLLLSYGEKKRLAVAAVLLRRPGTIVLDEPTAGLDGGRKKELLDYLQFLQQETGVAILLISHDLEMVLPYVSRVLCLRHGSIGFDGTAGQVLQFLPEEELSPYLQLLRRLQGCMPIESVPAPEALAVMLKKQ